MKPVDGSKALELHMVLLDLSNSICILGNMNLFRDRYLEVMGRIICLSQNDKEMKEQ